jgi:porin
MKRTNRQIALIIFTAVSISALPFLAAQSQQSQQQLATESNPAGYPAPVTHPIGIPSDSCPGTHVNIEDLSSFDADAVMPPFADSITGADNPLRRKMLCHDMTYRIVYTPGFTVNTLQSPVPEAKQDFIGQRPTWTSMVSYSIVADLASIHLPGVQLTAGAFFLRSNWDRAYPSALKMGQLIVYKPFFHRRLELKAGYQNNDTELIGIEMGGSVSNASQGVYAVLPFEVGLSYSPLSTPTFTVRAQPKGDFYAKIGLQRSTSAHGERGDLARDAAGFRFAPKGDGLLSVFEGGYNRASQAEAPQFWVRGGYLTNTTRYANAKTNTDTGGNHCYFLLADRQLRSGGPTFPSRGLYLGASAMSAPPELDAYSRYYELRLYQMAPFNRRPGDMLSLVSSYSNYSRYSTAQLNAAGLTAATHYATLTGSYTARVHSGTYISTGLSYDSRPAISPRLPGALTIAVQAAVFF